MGPIRVLLVDDHLIFRRGLAGLIAQQPGIQVVGEAGNGSEAVEKAYETMPDVVLMDVNMPGCNGVDGARLLCEAMPNIRVIMLTVSDEDEDLFGAIKAGAQGYLLKDLTPDQLTEALHGVMRGEAALSPPMAARLMQEFRDMAQQANLLSVGVALTSRETEILQMVAAGNTNKQIGAQLYLAPGTVKNHLHNILKKLQLQNRAQATAYAMRAGLIRAEGPRT